jgi:hypothetical protein
LFGSKWITNPLTKRQITHGVDLSGFDISGAIVQGANSVFTETGLALGANIANVSEIVGGNNAAAANLDLRGTGGGGVRLKGHDGSLRIVASDVGIGFNGAAPLAKPSVSGSKGGNVALENLITALSAYGLITDATS